LKAARIVFLASSFRGRPPSTSCRRPRNTIFVGVRIARDVTPDTSHHDRPAIERVLVEELASPVLKRADQGRIHNAHLAIDKDLTPLIRLRVVEKQSQCFPVAFRTFGLDFL
jgi:hypothetical protein